VIGVKAGTRGDEEGVVAALVMAKWLHFAAAPIFTTMALLTVVFDSDAPSVLCSAASSSTLNGMAPMYWLMAAFHLGPWLKLISRRRSVAGVTLFSGIDRSGDIEVWEQNR
jgi:hypothetical protein